MNSWISAIQAAGFEYDFNGSTFSRFFICLSSPKTMKVFQGEDTDAVLAEALQYAQNYDAFVNTAPTCHHE